MMRNMRFWINNYIQAKQFVPHEPTLAIRIFDPCYEKDKGKEGNHAGNLLTPNHWWTQELTYTFADLDPTIYEFESQDNFSSMIKHPHCFTNALARKLLTDFAANYENSASTMIHCNVGISRSPAVALALAHRFNLRPEWKGHRYKLMSVFETDLKTFGRAANFWVYSLLMETEF